MIPDQSPSESRSFSAVVTSEEEWFVAQCLEIDIASQGKTETEALENLREAIELHLEEPLPTEIPSISRFEIRTSAA